MNFLKRYAWAIKHKSIDIPLKKLEYNQKIQNGLMRAVLASTNYKPVPENVLTWEFSAFSQSGEDGIIKYLLQNAREKNKYFIEIGSADGIENNTAYFAFAEKYSGIMVEGDKAVSDFCLNYVPIGVKLLNLYVDKENIKTLAEHSSTLNPDIFSLDIDGMDYHLVKSILELGFKPKVFVVEYNSAYGPERSITIPYQRTFNFFTAHPSQLYYGVSISAWKKLFASFGYKFVTVNSTGVNAFFIQPAYFPEQFMKQIKGLDFAENFYQLKMHNCDHVRQFEKISSLEFLEIK